MAEIKSIGVRWLLRVFCRAWLVSGLVGLATGLGFAVYTSIWLYRSIPGRATVVELIQSGDQSDDSINYAPRFRFQAQNGNAYTVTSGVATNPPGFQVGDDVPVRYLATNPASAKLESFWQLWFVSVLCAGLGMFFSGAGYLLLRYERSRLAQ